jgi:hypothetical protein
MAAPRRVVLHAGLHKTGTTSLQSSLYHASDELRHAGFIYPRAGALEWLGGGHHNIAWELAGDHRWQARFGTIDDMAREIAASGLDAVVSAEDFESIIDVPARFAPLRNHPAVRDHQFALVVYVRNQVAYLESLYLEMLHHGVGAGLVEFAAPLFGDGKITFRDWAFHFDYAAVRERFADQGRIQIVVRNYHCIDKGSVITDFLGQLRPDAAIMLRHSPDRVNPRDLTADSLRMFFTNRQGREPLASEAAVIARIADGIGDRPVMLSPAWRELLAKRFDESNRQLCLAAGIESRGLIGSRPTSDNMVALERLFDTQIHDLILAKRHDELNDDQLDALLAPIPIAPSPA